MKIIKNKCYPLFIFTLLLLGCFGQKKADQAYREKRDTQFKQYLTTHNIAFKTLSDTIFNKYYGDFLAYEKKVKLEANPYLKVNKVYVHQVNSTAVEFTVYADDGTFSLSTYDLSMDGIILSKPVNGKVSVIEPIILKNYGDFKVVDDKIKTRVNQKSFKKEWYNYINGVIKGDTIFFSEEYSGNNINNFNKNWLSKKRKTILKEVYKAGLIAEKFLVLGNLIYFKVTGEFDLDSPVQPDIKFEK